MSDIQNCPTCGAALKTGETGQPCPACLMKLALDSAWKGGESEMPTQFYATGFKAPSIEELSARLPQFEVLELIGKGGMGAVYRARQKSLDRIVAIKIINPQAAQEPGFAERFGREARAMARLNQANIVTIHDFGQSTAGADDANDEPIYYLVMEFVDGANLRSLLRERRLQPAEALQIVRALCDALQYAHEEGIIHRDIKPENILIDRKGRVKIADFGLAKLLGRSPRDITLTEAHHALGTLHYMAPEQLERPLEVDHRADIYALGVTFYEMLTGELPLGRFALPSQKALVDVRLDEVVLRTLERQPERRYQHASDVKSAVQSCDAGSAPATNSSELVQETSRRLRAPAYALISYGCVLLAVVGVYLAGSMIQWQNDRIRETFDYIKGPGQMLVVGLALSVPIGFLAIIAGLRMLKCESYVLACVAAVLVMVPTTPFVFGFPIGIWVLVALNSSRVRAAFDEVKRQKPVSSNRVTVAPSSSAAYPPGAAPRLLIVTLGSIASSLLALAGAGLLVYSTQIYADDEAEKWAWYFGGGIGLFIGGIAGLMTFWNQSRTMRGQRDFMQDPNWNLWDAFLLVYGLIGAGWLAAALICWNSFDFWPRNAALIVGGIMALQGIGAELWRWAYRGAVARRPEQTALGLQMFLVAVGMLACGLLVVGGIAMSVYSATSLPGGSLKFWAGIAAAVVWLFGGAAGLLATWNWYRSLEGQSNWMTEDKTNLLDGALYAACAIGILLMIAAAGLSAWLAAVSVWALEVLGCMLVIPAAVFIAIRALLRRAVRLEAERPADS